MLKPPPKNNIEMQLPSARTLKTLALIVNLKKNS